MQGKDNFGNICQYIQEESMGFRDELIPTSEMRFDSLNNITLSGKTFNTQPAAQKILANKLSIPIQYLRRCPDYLQSANLNHWLERLPQKELFCRLDGAELRAVFTTRYKPLDNLQILERMLSPPGACR